MDTKVKAYICSPLSDKGKSIYLFSVICGNRSGNTAEYGVCKTVCGRGCKRIRDIGVGALPSAYYLRQSDQQRYGD